MHPLGNKPNKYHRVRNQYEGENHSEIGNIAGQAKAGSIAFADLTIQTPARWSAGPYSAPVAEPVPSNSSLSGPIRT